MTKVTAWALHRKNKKIKEKKEKITESADDFLEDSEGR